MTLTSYIKEDMGTAVGTGSWAGDVFTRPVLASSTTFDVAPNPCNNTGDHHHPVSYSFSKEVVVHPTGVTSTGESYNSPPSVHSASVTGPVQLGSSWVAWTWLDQPANDAYNRALEKLVSQLQSSDLNVSTSVGEGGETLKMMRSIARGAASSLTSLRKALKDKQGRDELKRLLRGARRDLTMNTLKRVGSGWLAWAVGVKPLLADLENFRNHVLDQRDMRVAFKLDSRASSEKTCYGSITASGHDWVVEQEYSHRVEFGAVVSVTDVHQFENWRAGLTVRPSLAWELTTLSFVVDYFYNIGQYLQLFEASVLNNGVKWEYGYCTQGSKDVQRKHCYYSKRTESPNNWTDWSFISRQYQSERIVTNKSRTLLSAFPMPLMPILKIPTASTPLLNIAALLSQILSEKK